MIVPDATKDPRFADNPLVTGEPHIRFYAGVPLCTPAGEKIGTLCIIDRKPRPHFPDSEQRNLIDLAALVIDKLELRRLELARRASQSRFENIAATSPDAIICTDESGTITFWNSAAERLTHYANGEVVGEKIELIVPDQISDKLHYLAGGDEPLTEGRTIELDVRRHDGSTVPVELSVSMWRDDGKASFGAILRDITERRSNELRLFRLAHLDPLTELPNRTLLRSRIGQALENEETATIMLVDLDGFKEVNDQLSHSVKGPSKFLDLLALL